MKRMVYCPECAAEVYKYDGFHTSEIVVRCPNCKKYVKFKPLGMTARIIDKPGIETSSGARFW